MIEAVSVFLACVVFVTETGEDWSRDRAWHSMTEQQRYEAPIEYKARAVGLTEEEFDLMSRVVYAESDRSSQEGMVLIALVLFNRVEDSRFEDTITDVCYESGQFQVVENGAIWSAGRTNQSDWAIIEAHSRIAEGLAPSVMYFNNSGYSLGEPYCYEGGNYFVTL